MSKRSNANKAAIKVLAIFLAIFGLAALSIAGLLEYYAKAIATVTVSQGVVVELVLNDGSTTQTIQLSHNPGSSAEVTLTATGIGGGETNEFYYNYNDNNVKVNQVKIKYLGGAVSEAPLTIELTLGDEFSGLFSEIVEYGVTIDSTTYKIRNNGVCVDSNCNNSGSWNSWNENNQVTVNDITFTKTDVENNRKLTITGLTLEQNSALTFSLYVVWNPATKPDTYTLTVTVSPA